MLRERRLPPADIFPAEPWALAAVRYSARLAHTYAGQAETMFALANGYLGIRGDASAAVKAEVDSINIKRRAVYTDRAAARGVSVEAIAAATGCRTLSTRVQAGHAYQLAGGGWQVRGAGDPPPVPGDCPPA